jgi:hypothetical protein
MSIEGKTGKHGKKIITSFCLVFSATSIILHLRINPTGMNPHQLQNRRLSFTMERSQKRYLETSVREKSITLETV